MLPNTKLAAQQPSGTIRTMYDVSFFCGDTSVSLARFARQADAHAIADSLPSCVVVQAPCVSIDGLWYPLDLKGRRIHFVADDHLSENIIPADHVLDGEWLYPLNKQDAGLAYFTLEHNEGRLVMNLMNRQAELAAA